MIKKVIFSGIQPSGILTLGSYSGAIKNWLLLQDNYDCYFCIVDLHALTVKQEPKNFQNNCYNCLAIYLACGLNPDKNTIFLQSHNKHHTNLMWLLTCNTYLGELARMTQFKDKSKQHTDNINAGLLNYPILMAADILLYQTDLVPVGEDQKQHIELCRNIAIRFNNIYGNIFKIAEPYIPKEQEGGKLKSLVNPIKKMSKSDTTPNAYIALTDPKDVIKNKIKKAVTDLEKNICYDPIKKPGISNLLQLFALATNQPINKIEVIFANKNYAELKSQVADALIALLEPIQLEYNKIRNEQNYLDQVLKKGAIKALDKSEIIMDKINQALGIINYNSL